MDWKTYRVASGYDVAAAVAFSTAAAAGGRAGRAAGFLLRAVPGTVASGKGEVRAAGGRVGLAAVFMVWVVACAVASGEGEASTTSGRVYVAMDGSVLDGGLRDGRRSRLVEGRCKGGDGGGVRGDSD